MIDSGNKPEEKKSIVAKDRVRTGPYSEWVKPCPFVEETKFPGDAQVSYLLFDKQIHAERHEMFLHEIIRLETMFAFPNWSQWRLKFDPKHQSVTLHSLTVCRGQNKIDLCNLEKARFLQQKEGLERFVITGCFTLLIDLEDVRPGDIVDYAYTIESRSETFPDCGGDFFGLPQDYPVGKYRFSVQFDKARQRKWQSSTPELTPIVKENAGMISWEWASENFITANPEVNTSSRHADLRIQVSDFPDWQTIAKNISKTWPMSVDDQHVSALAQKIVSEEAGLPHRIERAIRMVQAECRYVSVDLGFPGPVPFSSGEVLLRGFGDCKEFSFLLSNLLKKLGVHARPVLVNSVLRGSVPKFLPTPSVFNHVVVEIVLEGKRHWIEATFKELGGGPSNRYIVDYGCGLPVDAEATGLIEAPARQITSLVDLHEHILLDSKGGNSLMAVTLHYEGIPADHLRYELKCIGIDEWSKQRLQTMTSRDPRAKRIGSIKYHDDRDANIFVVAEVFEIMLKLGKHADSKKCVFNLPGDVLGHVLLMPPEGGRKQRLNHIIDVDNRGIKYQQNTNPQVDVASDFAVISRTSRTGYGHFTVRYALETRTNAVPPLSIQNHTAFLAKAAETFNHALILARNYPRPAKPTGFGELPSSIQPKPQFSPVSIENTQPLSPVIRTKSLLDKLREFLRMNRTLSVILIWLLPSILRSGADLTSKSRLR